MDHQLIYHILIDRFFPSGSEDEYGNFIGGNIRDIINHFDYIQGLGMTGIMLTPFMKTAAYHGYHTIDFDEVDPHFGTWADIAELVEETHHRGMIIVADFVANYCHDSSPLYADGLHPRLFRRDWLGHQKFYARIGNLPMFDTDNTETLNFLAEKALGLCRMGFDALRLDHATGPTYKFWKRFRARLKEQYPHVKLIGEVWGALDFCPRNWLRYCFNKMRYGAQEARQMEYVGILDGLLDFRYLDILMDAIHKNELLTNNYLLYDKIKRHFNRYPTDFRLWLFLDNHDLNRILFECDGNFDKVCEALRFTESWGHTMLVFYGTEKRLTNTKTIFDGTPYADERVRIPLTK